MESIITSLQNKKKVLYVIRAEADFERAVCLGIAGKEYFDQYFIFAGDLGLFFDDTIKNKFQKSLFFSNGFEIIEYFKFDLFASILSKLLGNKHISFREFREDKKYIFRFLISYVLSKYIYINKKNIIKKLLRKINPKALFTDQTLTDSEYLIEGIRQIGKIFGLPSFLYTHGASAGLLANTSDKPQHLHYDNSTVFVCNSDELNPLSDNKIIGDPCSSFPYVNYLNKNESHQISFLNDRTYRIGIFVGGTSTAFTITNAWFKQEEIIINLSERKDVAIVVKLHPREAPFIDLRILKTFKNVLIVNKETDRSRVSKWADIVVCNDHCSTIFEPMILGKKTVAIGGKRIPKYSNCISPLNHSSILCIDSADELDLEKIPNANCKDDIANHIAWGDQGPIDIAELFHQVVRSSIDK